MYGVLCTLTLPIPYRNQFFVKCFAGSSNKRFGCRAVAVMYKICWHQSAEITHEIETQTDWTQAVTSMHYITAQAMNMHTELSLLQPIMRAVNYLMIKKTMSTTRSDFIACAFRQNTIYCLELHSYDSSRNSLAEGSRQHFNALKFNTLTLTQPLWTKAYGRILILGVYRIVVLDYSAKYE